MFKLKCNTYIGNLLICIQRNLQDTKNCTIHFVVSQFLWYNLITPNDIKLPEKYIFLQGCQKAF